MWLRFVFALAFVLGSLVALPIAPEYVATPFGSRPRECVHEWESGARVVESKSEKLVRVHLLNGTVVVLPALPICLEAQQKWLSQYAKSIRRVGVNWQDGVLDDASYFAAPAYYVTHLSGSWAVPPNPTMVASHQDSQSLYYYLGVENRPSDSTGPTQLESTLGYSYGSWSLASWNCCPQGQSHYSRSITGLGKGDTVSGLITEAAPVLSGEWTIESSFGSKTTSLSVASLNRHFDTAHSSLDVYNVKECDALPDAAVTFSKLSVTTTEHTVSSEEQEVPEEWHAYHRGKPSPSPYNAWVPTTGATECGGSTAIKGSAVEIDHHY